MRHVAIEGRHFKESHKLERATGSVLLLTLIACLAAAGVILALSSTLLALRSTVAAEAEGRSAELERSSVLAQTIGSLADSWVEQESDTGGSYQFAFSLDPDRTGIGAIRMQYPGLGGTHVLEATAELGRDGPDLPKAAIVAVGIHMATARDLPFIGSDADGVVPMVALVRPLDEEEASAGFPYETRLLEKPWAIDEGTRTWLEEVRVRSLSAARPDAQLVFVDAGENPILSGAGTCPEMPMLLVSLAGGAVDLRYRGDLFGVVVADGGGVLLEGTCLHGALLSSGTLDLGDTGSVRWLPSAWRWASDRSLFRARPVPGTRREGWENP